jgi:hypothetical protein
VDLVKYNKSLNISIFHRQLNYKFKKYKSIDLNRDKIIVILLNLPNLARDQIDAALPDEVKSITR